MSDVLNLALNPLRQAFMGGQQPAGGAAPSSPAPGGAPGGGAPAAPPQQARAYQSPPDMAQANQQTAAAAPNVVDMYMQRQRMDDLSRGFSHLMAGFAQVRDRPAMMEYAAGGASPGQFAQGYSVAQEAQERGQELAAFHQNAGALGQLMGIPGSQAVGIVSALGPDRVGQVLSSNLTDTEKTKTIRQLISMFGAGGTGAGAGAGGLFGIPGETMTNVVAGIAGLPQTAIDRGNAARAWQAANPGKPLPDYFKDDTQFAEHTKVDLQQQQDVADARDQLPAFKQQYDLAQPMLDRLAGASNDELGNAQRLVSYLQEHPDAMAEFNHMRSLGNLPGVWANFMLKWKGVPTDPKSYSLASDILQLSSQEYVDAINRIKGGRRTQVEIGNVANALPRLVSSSGLDPDSYRQQVLNPLRVNFDTGLANFGGAAQDLDNIPANARPYVDKSYLPGGSLYRGAGGEWANDTSEQAINTAIRSHDVSSLDPAARDEAIRRMPHGTVFTYNGTPQRKP